MSLEVLIATMNNENIHYHEEMNLRTNVIVVNQGDKIYFDQYIEEYGEIKFVSTKDRGLSRSRNKALAYATHDIILFADDDIHYYEHTQEVILKAYDDYPEYDFIAFHVKGVRDRFYKKNKMVRINKLNLMRLSSVQISGRLMSIKKKELSFDIRFGAGSQYASGEENIFLAEALERGIKILYLPIAIGEAQESQSTWFQGFNESFFKSKGALFKRIYGKWAYIIAFQYCLRKYNEYKENYKLLKAYKAMINGCDNF